jgi:hypothetical protein
MPFPTFLYLIRPRLPGANAAGKPEGPFRPFSALSKPMKTWEKSLKTFNLTNDPV